MSEQKETMLNQEGVECEVATEALTSEQMDAVRAKVLESHDPTGIVWEANPRFDRLRAQINADTKE